MDCVIHSWDTEQVGEWVTIIQNKLVPEGEGLRRCKWILSAFTEHREADGRVYTQHWFKKGLLSHKVQECRASLAKLLVHAIQILSPSEQETGGPIPYCTITENDDSEIHVMQDGQYVPSLLTDFPFARSASYRGTPFPQPVTVIGNFIDNILELLPEMPRYWRYYGEYFLLLANFASLGRVSSYVPTKFLSSH